jgi:hypothetical protein
MTSLAHEPEDVEVDPVRPEDRSWWSAFSAELAGREDEIDRLRYEDLLDDLDVERSGLQFPDWPEAEMVEASEAVYPGSDD